ncbi:MAG TPA: response regulator [Candidatus Binatus sp.]|nr:response regulator [Candidatus Binatus sp.]
MEHKTILIVEDDRDLLMGLSVRLSSRGFTALSAPDAATAIQMVAIKKPDLILLDLGLPDSNGFVVMNIVSQFKCATPVPIIVVSARPAHVYREPALLAGARDYFEKPFDNDTLMSAIQRELGEESSKLLEATACLPPPSSTD